MRGISFHVDAREVVAIVGESGSGKSAAAMAIMGLVPEYARVTGSVRLDGTELLRLSDAAMSEIRGRRIGMVFQDPMSALTPVYTIGDQIAEAITVHRPSTSRRAARQRAVELLELVGIAQAERRARAFPHELSGGERQRVVIAIAIANDPDLLICDEPTTALDVTVQPQILDVLRTARDVTGAGCSSSPTTWASSPNSPTVRWSCTRAERLRSPRSTISIRTARCPTPQVFWVPLRV